MTDLDQARMECNNKPSKKNIRIYDLLLRNAQMQYHNDVLLVNATMWQTNADNLMARIDAHNALPWYKRIFTKP